MISYFLLFYKLQKLRPNLKNVLISHTKLKMVQLELIH